MCTLLFKFQGMGHKVWARRFMDCVDREKIPVGILDHISSVEVHDADPAYDKDDLTCTGVLVGLGGNFNKMTVSIYAKYVMDAKETKRYSAYTPWAYFEVSADVRMHDCKEHPLRNPVDDESGTCECNLLDVPIGKYLIIYRVGFNEAVCHLQDGKLPQFNPGTRNPIVTYWNDKMEAINSADLIRETWANRYGVQQAKRILVLQYAGAGQPA